MSAARHRSHPSPWPGGSTGDGHPHPHNHHPRHGHDPRNDEQNGDNGRPTVTTTTTKGATGRRPRNHASAAASPTAGQSRFVEGSMNDRVSAAPPPGFLGPQHDDDEGKNDDWERRFRHYPPPSSSSRRGYEQVLRRPRSSAGWNSGGATAGGAAKKSGSSSFLAPLWDGVREKLSLRSTKSSGSISRMMGYGPYAGGGKGQKAEGQDKAMGVGMGTGMAVGDEGKSAYPTREEVMESYKSLVASGFFDAHAIRGGRHPLKTGPAQGMPPPTAAAALGSKSFADHMVAHQQQQQHQQQIKSAVDRPKTSVSACPPAYPPPPPPRVSSQRSRHSSVPPSSSSSDSPQRGTKRGASLDMVADAESTTRKLVKKLRHSASRMSTELSLGSHHPYPTITTTTGAGKPRLSTSSARPALFAMQSPIFAGSGNGSAPPSIVVSDETARHGKLVKPKEKEGGGRRRRILGLGRRHRSPTPAAAPAAAEEMMDVDADVMMVDPPDPQPASQQRRSSGNIGRVPTSPPAPAPPFYHYHYPQRLRTSPSVNSMQQQHEPLSVMPDPNQGIPIVPWIPSGLRASSLSPTVVVITKEQSDEGTVKTKKTVNRDSGLGEDVENIPVAAWS